MPASRRRKRRRSRSGWLPFELPRLEQRHWDLIGLGLVAFAAFFACVFYLGWAGGQVGQALADGMLFMFGGVGYLAPVALFAAGALLVVRPMMQAVHPFKTGAACLLAGLTLGLAAGSLGLGPGDTPRDGFLDADYLREHGGLTGESLFWTLKTLFSEAGAHILFVFLMLAAALLLTGASIAGLVQATRDAATTTGARVRRTAGAMGLPTEVLEPSAPPRSAALPPEPEDEEPVVRATHVEAPVPELDAAERYPDLYEDEEPVEDEEDEEDYEPAEELDEPEPEELTPMGNRRSEVTEADDVDYRMPKGSFLKRSNGPQKVDTKGIERTGGQLVEALSHFNVEARTIGTVTGPHVTRYELRLAPGVKMSKVAQLKDDLAYALAAEQVRILAPIPGKQAVGVEVPNRVRKMVHLGDVFQDAPKGWSPLSVWLGKDIAGKAIGTDLAKQPHILIAGTTGSGKSGCVNAMLSSVLLRSDPNEVRMVLVDPKRVELNHYEGIPHLLTPVVTSPRLAANVLGNLIKEMEERYGVMSRAKTRSLVELNRVRVSQGERPLPYILCVIDELADLMMVAPADVEDSIIRLAQKSRAVGIHLVLATQRPERRRDHRHDQGQRAGADRLRRLLADRLARDPRPERRRVAAGPGRHALPACRRGALGPHPGRLHHRGGDRAPDRLLAPPGRARAPGGAAGGGRVGRRRRGGRGRLRPRSGRSARRRDRHRGADGHRVHVDAAAPPAGGLHACGAPDRHDGAARRDLRLRGLEGSPGADHRGRPAARARSARRRGGHGVVGGRPARLKKRREKPTPLLCGTSSSSSRWWPTCPARSIAARTPATGRCSS